MRTDDLFSGDELTPLQSQMLEILFPTMPEFEELWLLSHLKHPHRREMMRRFWIENFNEAAIRA